MSERTLAVIEAEIAELAHAWRGLLRRWEAENVAYPIGAIAALAERRAEIRAVEARLAGLWTEKRTALTALTPLVGELLADDMS